MCCRVAPDGAQLKVASRAAVRQALNEVHLNAGRSLGILRAIHNRRSLNNLASSWLHKQRSRQQ